MRAGPPYIRERPARDAAGWGVDSSGRSQAMFSRLTNGCARPGGWNCYLAQHFDQIQVSLAVI